MNKEKGARFLGVSSEGESIVGHSLIWESDAKESLEEIIDEFLASGKIQYTDISEEDNPKITILEYGEYPNVKLILWEQKGRFRKRPEEKGGNIRQLYE